MDCNRSAARAGQFMESSMKPSKPSAAPASLARPAMMFCAGLLVLTTLPGVVAAVGGAGPRQAAANTAIATAGPLAATQEVAAGAASTASPTRGKPAWGP